MHKSKKSSNTVYRFDSTTLDYKRLTIIEQLSQTRVIIAIVLAAFTLFSLLSIGLKPNITERQVEDFSEPELIMIYERVNEFSEESLKQMLIDMNVKHRDIVFAQAKLETGNFTSIVFKNNHNLFGMREAKSRVSMNIGTELGHAKYRSWRESVIDYALYQSTYLHKLSREQYWQYLSQYYAEAPNYVQTLKQIVKNQKNANRK
jgi:hypothetical protein